MMTTSTYATTEPERADIDALTGPTVLEFGTPWCGYCVAAQPLVQAAFAGHPDVQHIRIEDGPGRPLGRSYRIKLWPTLVFLRDGQEIGRLVRPRDSKEIARQLQVLDAPSSESGDAGE